MVKLLICGAGNGAHVLAGLASSKKIVEETRVLTLFEDEAERWTEAMKDNDFVVRIHGKSDEPVTLLKSKPSLVTKDPSVATRGCDMIVFTVPAFAHAVYLEAVKSYVKPGTIIIGLPGNAGFEFAVSGILGSLAKECTIMSFESLPWVARVKSFGRGADLCATKESLKGACQMGSVNRSVVPPIAIVQKILGDQPLLDVKGHLLGMTFMGVNAYIHPPIIYGRWHGREKEAVDKPPLFYHGVDKNSIQLISGISDEVLALGESINKQRANADMSNVEHVYDFYRRVYGNNPDMCSDPTNLYTLIRSFKGYEGLTHPCVKGSDGKLHFDFTSRYLTEDIPYGLLVIKGVAEIAAVETPIMDKILIWAQSHMGKEYICDGKLTGKDVKESRAPQAYGITDLDEMLGL